VFLLLYYLYKIYKTIQFSSVKSIVVTLYASYYKEFD